MRFTRPALSPRPLVAIVLLTCAGVALPAQQPATASHIPLEQMASAFSTHALASHAHSPNGGGMHAMKASAAVADTRAPAHSPSATPAAATGHSAVLDAFAPAERSALSAGTHRQPHAPASHAAKGLAGSKSVGTATQPNHVPAAKAKP